MTISKKKCFSTKIAIALKEKLQSDLENQGFTISHPPNSLFQARKKNLTCTLYASGSLVVQGKDIDDFMKFYLEPEILQTFHYSYPEIHTDMTPRIGVDEAGKGDFFGPLCIAGIFADESHIQKLLQLGIKDSKNLSDATIKKIAKELKMYPHVVIRLYPEKYNVLYKQFKNLNLLLGWAHATVIADVQKKTHAAKAIIDQFASSSVVTSALKKKNVQIELEQRHRGEEDIVVAAASILARDSFLEGLDKLSTEISFVLPKGASSLVKDAAKKIIEQKNKEILPKIAKMHFKTANEILNS